MIDYVNDRDMIGVVGGLCFMAALVLGLVLGFGVGAATGAKVAVPLGLIGLALVAWTIRQDDRERAKAAALARTLKGERETIKALPPADLAKAVHARLNQQKVIVRECVPAFHQKPSVDVVATVTRDGRRDHKIYINRAENLPKELVEQSNHLPMTLISGDALSDWLHGRTTLDIWGTPPSG